jgi:putative ABC transport system permease protein
MAQAGTLGLALRSLRRDWRSGEMRVIALALLVAVAAVTAVGFFTDRVERAMAYQASELLAADLVVESSAPPSTELADEAVQRGLATARTSEFPSVVLLGERTALAQVKAVDDAYPLRGRLRVADVAFGEEYPIEQVPVPGTVWVEARLLAQLDAEPGALLQVGARALRIDKVLTYEPDRGGSLFQLAPRLLLNRQDLASTELIGPASRARHNLLVSGAEPEIAAYRSWLETRVTAAEEVQGVTDARPEVRVALERAQRFLGLAALTAVLLGGAAIAVAARHFAERQADAGAIMRCLGASQAQVLRLFIYRLLGIGLLSSLVATAVGFGAQAVLAGVLGHLFVLGLPAPSAAPVLTGLGTGLATLLGFALPPVLRLRQVAPLRVLRRDLPLAPPSAWTVGGLGLAAVALLMLWQAQDVKLAALVVGGTVATVVVLAAVAWLLLRVATRARRGAGLAWRFGLAGLARRGTRSILQMVAIGLGIMALLLLALVRVDLLDAWQRTLPEDAPNHFLINVQPDEVAGLQEVFAEQGYPPPTLYPMIRGRLVQIGERSIVPEDYVEPRAQRLLQREFNLSWGTELGADNVVVAGEWAPQDPAAAGFSVETGLAETLGIALGDRLIFEVAGERIDAEVTSLRTVEWDSFNVNFFVVAPPSVLQDYPATWITSFHLPEAGTELLTETVRRYPSVTVLDIRALMEQVRTIMDRANLAVEFVFLFTLAAGLTVLFAAIQSTREERLREGAVLRTLGARRGQVLRGILAEFGLLGALAGLLAATAASAVGYVVAIELFQLDYGLNAWVWVVGVLAGGLGIGLAGALATRSVLAHPPLAVLRQR